MTRMKTYLTRRGFLRALAGFGAAWTLAPDLPAVTRRQPVRKPIPVSGERLPVIGLGTARTFNVVRNPHTLAELGRVVQAFFDHGGELIDSSPMYGNAEYLLGQLLPRVSGPHTLFAATKVWTDGRRAGIEQMERSRRLWGVARFDLVQIHNLRDWRTHLATLRDWKAAGKVRYIGITTSHGLRHDELVSILTREPLDFVQFSYNIADRAAEDRLLPLAADRGLATLVNRPFQRGGLFRRVRGRPLPAWVADYGIASWAQFLLKFIVSHPAVTCVIPATSRVDHLVDNMGANYGRLPDAGARQRMIEHFAAL